MNSKWDDPEFVRAYQKEYQARRKAGLMPPKPPREPRVSKPWVEKPTPPPPVFDSPTEPTMEAETWTMLGTFRAISEPSEAVYQMALAEQQRRIQCLLKELETVGEEITLEELNILINRIAPETYKRIETRKGQLLYISSMEVEGVMRNNGWMTPLVDGYAHKVYRRTEKRYNTPERPLVYPWDYYYLGQEAQVKELCRKAEAGMIPAEQLRLGCIAISQDERHCTSRLVKAKRTGIWPLAKKYK